MRTGTGLGPLSSLAGRVLPQTCEAGCVSALLWQVRKLRHGWSLECPGQSQSAGPYNTVPQPRGVQKVRLRV